MFSSVIRSLFRSTRVPTPRTARLSLDVLEDREVPASVTFAAGVLFVDADAATSDVVVVTPTGPARDGSTGVRLTTNVTGTWTSQKFGGVGTPVTNIALDMKDGNDFVSVSSLRSTIVLVGEGNGNNFVSLGDTLAGGVIAGSGQNVISVGNSTLPNAFTSFNLPGTANAVAFVGWGYSFAGGGTGIFLGGNTGNANNNVVRMGSDPGFRAFVDIVGTGNNVVAAGRGDDGVSIIGGGNNTVAAGSGNDLVILNGNGNNCVRAGQGDDTITINGNGNNTARAGTGTDTVNVNGGGNNTVSSRGSGSVTVNGGGKNAVHARYSSNLTIGLNGAGAGSSVVAALTAGVFVDGTQVTESGTVGNVKVKFV